MHLSVLLPIPCYLDYYGFIVILEVGSGQSFDFLLQYNVNCSGSFAFPYKVWNELVDIHKVTCWDFDWDLIESTDQIENN